MSCGNYFARLERWSIFGGYGIVMVFFANDGIAMVFENFSPSPSMGRDGLLAFSLILEANG